MQLTRYADYALRTLIYLGVMENGGTAAGVAAAYGISRHHLVKVAHKLGSLGYVNNVRGKTGGMSLAMDPAEINIGKVLREMEPGFALVECFGVDDHCPITGVCHLEAALFEARKAFFGVLDRYSLEDVLANRDELRARLLTDAK